MKKVAESEMRSLDQVEDSIGPTFGLALLANSTQQHAATQYVQESPGRFPGAPALAVLSQPIGAALRKRFERSKGKVLEQWIAGAAVGEELDRSAVAGGILAGIANDPGNDIGELAGGFGRREIPQIVK
jgi:hypothetical protein